MFKNDCWKHMSNDKKTFSVTAEWDPEAKVWVAVSDDIPGLVTEAMSLQKLVEKLQILIPELCELNKHLIKTPLEKISICANYQRFEEERRVS